MCVSPFPTAPPVGVFLMLIIIIIIIVTRVDHVTLDTRPLHFTFVLPNKVGPEFQTGFYGGGNTFFRDSKHNCVQNRHCANHATPPPPQQKF